MNALLLMTVIALAQAKVLPLNRMKKEPTPSVDAQTNPLNNNSTVMSFGNVQDLIYYINLEVGTPSQMMGVQFDTGSNILWLPTQKSGAPNFFNTSKSSTFTNTSNPGSVQYADGSGVSGTYGTDILSITGTTINITAQYLWVTQETSMNFPNQVQGLVGMGYTSTPNFLDIAYQNNQIQSPVFTLLIQPTTQQSYIYFNQIP